MTVFPVKHSALLRQPEFLLPRPQLVQLIEKLTDNRSLLPMKAANSYCGWMTGASSIPKAGPAGNGRTASVCTACITTTSRPAMKNAGDYRRLVPSAPAEGTPTKNVNTVCPLLTLAYRYEETRNPALLPVLERWAEWVMYEMPRTEQGGLQHIVYNNENHQQLWDDTLMMSVLPLAKIGKLLNRPEYVEEASYQFLLHVQYLMDRETGLWFHGWNFDGRHNCCGALGARQ